MRRPGTAREPGGDGRRHERRGAGASPPATASIPVEKRPAWPLPRGEAPAPPRTPADREYAGQSSAPTANSTQAMAATNTATGTGTPTPPPLPAARAASKAPPTQQKRHDQHPAHERRPASAPCAPAARRQSRASPTAFIASTGNTQGIRLRISPPRKANQHPPHPACAAGCGPGGGVTAPARRLPGAVRHRQHPPVSTPDAAGTRRPGSARRRRNRPVANRHRCGAAPRRSPARVSGTNQACRSRRRQPSAAPLSTPSGAIRAAQGDGRWARASAAANSAASAEGAAVPAVRSRVKPPGFRHADLRAHQPLGIAGGTCARAAPTASPAAAPSPV